MLKSLERAPDMSRALQLNDVQSSLSTTTSSQVIAIPVAELCGLSSSGTHGYRHGTVGRRTEFTEIGSLCFHQTTPRVFIFTIQLGSCSNHFLHYSCPPRSRWPSALCRVPRHCGILVLPWKTSPFVAARVIIGCSHRGHVTREIGMANPHTIFLKGTLGFLDFFYDLKCEYVGWTFAVVHPSFADQ